MSDYCRVRFSAVYSENSDYSSAEFQTQWNDYELTPDEGAYYVVEAATGGTTHETSNVFSTVTLYAVRNTDTTNYVDVTWNDTGANSNTQRIPAGGILVLSDLDPSTDPTLTANTATVRCKVIIVGT